jgi:hypothetical protein
MAMVQIVVSDAAWPWLSAVIIIATLAGALALVAFRRQGVLDGPKLTGDVDSKGQDIVGENVEPTQDSGARLRHKWPQGVPDTATKDSDSIDSQARHRHHAPQPSPECPHERTTKLGTNGVINMLRCMDCGDVLKYEYKNKQQGFDKKNLAEARQKARTCEPAP